MTWKPIGSSGKFRVAPDQKRALGDIELNTESVLFYVADCLLGKNKQNLGEQQTQFLIDPLRHLTEPSSNSTQK